eukprot:8177168-Ditylum_brightwellii.AAC.1
MEPLLNKFGERSESMSPFCCHFAGASNMLEVYLAKMPQNDNVVDELREEASTANNGDGSTTGAT